ncbi:MAG: hypothetical protein V4613_05155 [Bacteroidota bacterium]
MYRYSYRITFILIVILTISCGSPKSKKTHSPDFASGLRLSTTEPTVVFFISLDCPICQKYQGSYKPLLQQFDKKADFLFIVEGDVKDEEVRTFCKYDSIPTQMMLIDDNGFFAKSLGATVTPQVKIYSSAGIGKYAYSGAIDDRFPNLGSQRTEASINYVEKALISLLNHVPVEIPETTPVGCFIEPQ